MVWAQRHTFPKSIPLHRFGAEGTGACPDGLWQQPATFYLDFIVSLKFNALRLPLAADNVLSDPVVGKWSLTANPDFQGLRSLALLERLVVLAAARGLLVVLDMHRLSAAIWPTGHGLWYSDTISEAVVHDAWRSLSRRFCQHWNVIAADVFNEPHGASWGPSTASEEKKANQQWGRGRDWTTAAASLGEVSD
jgi:endoglucanase